MEYDEIRQWIERAWDDRSLLENPEVQQAILQTIDLLDQGRLRVASPNPEGDWEIHTWVKKAVVLYFPLRPMETLAAGPLEWRDKIPLKTDYASRGVRAVPPAAGLTLPPT